MKSKKQIKKVEVPFRFGWAYGVELKRLREDLDALEKLGVTEIYIDVVESYDGASIEVKAFAERLETDEEYRARVNAVKRMKQEQRQRELEQLERLKAKYEIRNK